MNENEMTVGRYMTKSPHTIGAEQPMSEAHRVMRMHKLRHLPVLHGGKIVGIVSDRDLHLVESLDDVDPARVRVEEAMVSEPYHVSPDTPLKQAATTMAEHKYGCVVVTERNKVTGILTTVDACRALAELL